MTPTHISIVNRSTMFADSDLPSLANCLQIQVTRDFLPAWGVDARIYYTPTGKNPSPDHWVIALLDDADQAGALGYHDKSPNGLPLGKAFVRTTLANGGSISVTVSHELLEMLGDPDINLTALAGNLLYAYEVGDAVEADDLGYEIEIPTGWPDAGRRILVSDFVLPSWFEEFRTSGPFAFRTNLSRPFELAPGGYIGILDLSHLNRGWQQLTARATSTAARALARPRAGSRRSRRSLERPEWLASTYPTGAESIPAESAEGVQNV